jgi:hypothetical protein
MNNRLLGITVAVIGLIGGLFYLVSLRSIDHAVSFSDVEIQSDTDVLAQVGKGYISLPSITAQEDAIVDLIGAIAVRDKLKNDDPWRYLFQYRPSRDQIKISLVDESLFHGIVSVNADFGGHFNIASGQGAAQDLAETTIRNQLIVGYKDPADIPFQALSKIDFSPTKDYYYISRVIVTDITTRRFRKFNGEGKVDGLAFGANGSIYTGRDAVRSRKVVSFLPINPLDLQASEAGSGNAFTQLTAKSRRDRLTSEESSALVSSLVEKAQANAPKTIPLEATPPKLPALLQNLQPLIWYDDLPAIRQSSENRCWAAATAMLFSWKKQRRIGEAEAVTSLGPIWEDTYQRDASLPRSYKYEFLTAAGLDFNAPKSYHPDGLVSLIKDKGPAWFTIDQDFGRHATILTGVFFDPDTKQHWISYIDPTDGRLKADDFPSFMRRYEVLAYRANEEGIEPVMTFNDLDIQVIHW